jgi:hypothetical protein
MSSTLIPAATTLQQVLLLAVVAGLTAAVFAWFDGGRARVWCVPIGLLAATVPLVASHQLVGPDLVFWIVFVGAIAAGWTGTMTWRGGSRWRVLFLPLGGLAFAAPLVVYGFALAGFYGALLGALVAWWLAFPWILLSALCLLSDATDKARAAAWGVTIALVPAIALDVVFREWLHALCSVGALAAFWAWDYTRRTRGPWDHLDPWIEEKASRIAALTSFAGTVYPVYWILAMRMDAFGLKGEVVRIFGTEAIDPVAMLVAPFALGLAVMAWLHAHLGDDKDRARIAGTAVIPLALWGVAALVLPPDIGTAGFVGAVVLMLATCVRCFITTNPQT